MTPAGVLRAEALGQPVIPSFHSGQALSQGPERSEGAAKDLIVLPVILRACPEPVKGTPEESLLDIGDSSARVRASE